MEGKHREISSTIDDAITYWQLEMKRQEAGDGRRAIYNKAKAELRDLLKVDATVHPELNGAGQEAADEALKAMVEECGIGPDEAGEDGKEVLVIEKGELPKVAETLRDIIAKSNVFFDRGVPVRITKRAGSKLPIASALTTHGVVRAAHQLCRPIKDAAYATLPDRVAALYLDMAGEWKLPQLW